MIKFIKNVFKIAKLLAVDDSGDLRVGIMSSMGKRQKILIFSPYGLMHNPPIDSLTAVWSQLAQESNGIGMADDPANRPVRDMVSGEVAVGNYSTGDYIYFTAPGDTVETVSRDKTVNVGRDAITVTGNDIIDAAARDITTGAGRNVSLDAAAAVTIESGGTTDITAGGDMSLDAANATIDAATAVTIDAGADVDITAGGDVNLTGTAVKVAGVFSVAGGFAITGNLTITGGLIVNGKNVSDTHTHGIFSGSSAPGPTSGVT